CPDGIYTPSDRDSLRIHIQHGNPHNFPIPIIGFSSCQFYPIFNLHGSGDSNCVFTNVWVCISDSFHGVTTCGGTFTNPSSTCTGDTLYKNKDRRYPEYVNPDEVINGILNSNPEQQSGEKLQMIIDECHANCEAQADVWMNTLRRCGYSPTDSITLRAALIDI